MSDLSENIHHGGNTVNKFPVSKAECCTDRLTVYSQISFLIPWRSDFKFVGGQLLNVAGLFSKNSTFSAILEFQRGIPLALMTFTPEPRCLFDASSPSNRDLLYHPSQNHTVLLSRNCSGGGSHSTQLLSSSPGRENTARWVSAESYYRWQMNIWHTHSGETMRLSPASLSNK